MITIEKNFLIVGKPEEVNKDIIKDHLEKTLKKHFNKTKQVLKSKDGEILQTSEAENIFHCALYLDDFIINSKSYSYNKKISLPHLIKQTEMLYSNITFKKRDYLKEEVQKVLNNHNIDYYRLDDQSSDNYWLYIELKNFGVIEIRENNNVLTTGWKFTQKDNYFNNYSYINLIGQIKNKSEYLNIIVSKIEKDIKELKIPYSRELI